MHVMFIVERAPNHEILSCLLAFLFRPNINTNGPILEAHDCVLVTKKSPGS